MSARGLSGTDKRTGKIGTHSDPCPGHIVLEKGMTVVLAQIAEQYM